MFEYRHVKKFTWTILDDKTFSTVSKVFKILSGPTRISLLNFLENKELIVGALGSNLSLEQPAVSHQLKILKSARLVKSRRVGKMKVYSQQMIMVIVLHMLEDALRMGRCSNCHSSARFYRLVHLKVNLIFANTGLCFIQSASNIFRKHVHFS